MSASHSEGYRCCLTKNWCAGQNKGIFSYVTVNPTKDPCLSVHVCLAVTNSQVFYSRAKDNKKPHHNNTRNLTSPQCIIQSVLNRKPKQFISPYFTKKKILFGFPRSKEKRSKLEN